MRVAYVCSDAGVPVFGSKGCSIHVQEIIRELVRQRAEVELFAVSAKGPAPADLSNIAVHALCDGLPGDVALREQALLGMNEALREKLDKNGPFDLVYERYALWSYAAMEWAEAAGLPALLEVNAPLIEEQSRHRALIDRENAVRATTRALAAASSLIAVSEGIAEYLGRISGDSSRIHVIPNGVRPDRFSVNLSRGRSRNDGFTIGFVGSLKPWHGMKTLIDAFRILCRDNSRTGAKKVELLIVGDGPLRPELKREIEDQGLRGVTFTGATLPDDVPAWMARMDVGLAPYPGLPQFYFSPLKVVEYMAAGLPVVASRVGCLPDLVEHGVTGLLCPPDDPPALAGALLALLHDPEFCCRLGEAGRDKALKHHTWESVVRRILNVAAPALV
jgi:glycosyltransferase involved in cell wall biosynthesis